ncbi:ABC transporter permease [Helcococcus kunzii]|uniref:ABC transporter permease n=1 Tax=Helcococcus kunzii TaxID=40091 RepID=UPI0024ACB6A1|nr:ABC transporter permease [Helcococcus kunzii]
MKWILDNLDTIFSKTFEHFIISLLSLGIGSLISVPIGILVSKSKKLSSIVLSIASVLQTLPSLALLAIMVPFFGVGRLPAIVALVVYSLLPILRNTILGIESVDKNAVDASYGMGMSYWQVLTKVQIPLALPIIISGISLSGIYVVAWATIASYIGAGGLGDLIFIGLNNYNFAAIYAGAIPVTLMALLFEFGIGKIEERFTPKHLTRERE